MIHQGNYLFFSILQTQYKFVYMTIMEYVNKFSTPHLLMSVHQH